MDGSCIDWNLTPLPAGYFAPGPYPPDGQFHPFSDAVKYDLGGQYMIIGEGILMEPLPTAQFTWLFWLVALAGWTELLHFDDITGIGTGIERTDSLFYWPASIKPQSRCVVSILFILQEANTITATRYVSVSHARWMLTELPAMLLMAAATLAFLSAYRRKPTWSHLLDVEG
jgi:hypothetical protein